VRFAQRFFFSRLHKKIKDQNPSISEVTARLTGENATGYVTSLLRAEATKWLYLTPVFPVPFLFLPF